jgi:hypothetical protein
MAVPAPPQSPARASSGVGVYKPGAICERVHLESSDITFKAPSGRCADCGRRSSRTARSATSESGGYCDLRGFIGGSYDKPDFCDNCDDAFPAKRPG